LTHKTLQPLKSYSGAGVETLPYVAGLFFHHFVKSPLSCKRCSKLDEAPGSLMATGRALRIREDWGLPRISALINPRPAVDRRREIALNRNLSGAGRRKGKHVPLFFHKRDDRTAGRLQDGLHYPLFISPGTGSASGRRRDQLSPA